MNEIKEKIKEWAYEQLDITIIKLQNWLKYILQMGATSEYHQYIYNNTTKQYFVNYDSKEGIALSDSIVDAYDISYLGLLKPFFVWMINYIDKNSQYRLKNILAVKWNIENGTTTQLGQMINVSGQQKKTLADFDNMKMSDI